MLLISSSLIHYQNNIWLSINYERLVEIKVIALNYYEIIQISLFKNKQLLKMKNVFF
jgi:hypothetical protein